MELDVEIQIVLKRFHLNLFTKTLALISTATLILKSKVYANDIYLLKYIVL